MAGGSWAVVKMSAPRAAGGLVPMRRGRYVNGEPVRGCAGLVLRPFRCNLPLSAYFLLDPGRYRAESDSSHRKTPYRYAHPYDPPSMGATEWSRAPGGAGAGALCDHSAAVGGSSAAPVPTEG